MRELMLGALLAVVTCMDRTSLLAAILGTLLILTGCTSESSTLASLDGPPPPTGSDSGADGGGSNDMIVGPPSPPTALPLGPSAALTLGGGGGIDVQAALFASRGGADAAIVYDHFDAAFSTGELRSASLTMDGLLSTPTDLFADASTFAANPSGVERVGTAYLYYVRAATLQGSATIERRERQGSSWGPPQVVSLPAITLLSWPRFIALPDDRVALGYRDGLGQPRVALSSDGLHFDSASVVESRSSAMVAVGSFSDGQLVCTYQTESAAAPMTSWVRRSRDGVSWSPPLRVTSSSTNVHDTAPLSRVDGGIDLYYIYPVGQLGFVLFRRRYGADGTLGLEERVTDDSFGEVSKPSGVRLADGRLLLTYAAITARDPVQGFPSVQQLGAVLLAGDAP